MLLTMPPYYVLVLGSSNVRRVEGNLRRYIGKKDIVRCHTLPGGSVDDVIHDLPEALESLGNGDVRVLAHVGTNDACRRGSEEIVNSLRKLTSVVHTLQQEKGVELRLFCSII